MPEHTQPDTQSPPGSAPPPPGGDGAPMRLRLTDFVEGRTLQELQDSFTALTGFAASIRDADGRALTSPSDAAGRRESDRVLEWLMAEEINQAHAGPLTAPIIVAGQTLGSITIMLSPEAGPGSEVSSPQTRDPRPRTLSSAPNHTASVQFLYLLANSIARLCYQEYELRKRVDELSALYALSTALARPATAGDVRHVLETAAREAAETFNVKAVSIRLLDESRRELRVACVHNLSDGYLGKGPLRLEEAPVFQTALAQGIAYVADMGSDERVVYPEEAQREGLVSQLCAGILFKGEPIGVLQLFSGGPRRFSRYESELLAAIAQLLAAAIHNARLEDRRKENERVERQLKMAADVQRRMLPAAVPKVKGFEIATRYVPSFELGGDFYDFLELSGNLGVAVADVSGKGLAASLLMASVRSSLRAFAQDLYDIDHIMARVNAALCRDTRANEFTTLFYGVIEPRTRRLTYCNAGHEPPLLLRRGTVRRLEAGGMVVGVDPAQRYDKGLWDLEPGDVMLIYTDGLMDAMNFDGERFGRERITGALHEAADKSAHEAVNHILWQMRRFAGLNVRTDDTTLVMIRCV